MSGVKFFFLTLQNCDILKTNKVAVQSMISLPVFHWYVSVTDGWRAASIHWCMSSSSCWVYIVDRKWCIAMLHCHQPLIGWWLFATCWW